MRLDEGVGVGTRPILLEPFGHQVAGQSSMLTVDSATVCKPLIPREHFVYCTIPPQLLPYTPQYKGVLFVRLHEEEDGCIRLLGYKPQTDGSEDSEVMQVMEGREEDKLLQAPSEISSGASTPMSSGSELDLPSAVEADGQPDRPQRPVSGCVVRVLQCGSYEVSASTMKERRFLISQHHNDGSGMAKEGSSGGVNSSPPTVTLTQPLNPWGLSCHTRLLDKMRKSRPSPHGCPFIQLENVVGRFSRPCILDLKVGSRLHGDNASQQKIASQSGKCNATTSRTLGLRLCGMQVYQVDTDAYRSMDKYHGRRLTDTTFRTALRDFLHNGHHMRRELLAPILSRLNDLVQRLEELDSFRFYASSLLIIYDGVGPGEKNFRAVDGSRTQAKDDSKRLPRSCVTERQASENGPHSPRSASNPVSPSVTSTCGGQDGPKRAKEKQADDVSSHPPQVCVTGDGVKGSSSDSSVDHMTANNLSSGEVDKQSRHTLRAASDTCLQNSDKHVGDVNSFDNGNSDNSGSSLVDVRMIDFAHTTHSGFPDDTILHQGPDRDYISGLRSLITLFSELLIESDLS